MHFENGSDEDGVSPGCSERAKVLSGQASAFLIQTAQSLGMHQLGRAHVQTYRAEGLEPVPAEIKYMPKGKRYPF